MEKVRCPSRSRLLAAAVWLFAGTRLATAGGEPAGLWQGRREDWQMITTETRVIETDRRFGSAELWRWRFNDARRPKPPIVAPKLWTDLAATARPPDGAIVLFAGTNTDAWQSPAGRIEDGCLVADRRNGDLVSKEDFGSCQLHVEWLAPSGADEPNKGRPRSESSGILLMSTYEVHVPESVRAAAPTPPIPTGFRSGSGCVMRRYASATSGSSHWSTIRP